MRLLALVSLTLWASFSLAPPALSDEATLRAENALLRAKLAQLEAQLAERSACGPGATGDVAALLDKLGSQEEAHAWAMLGLSDAPLILPDSVLASVVPGEYLLLTDQSPEALGLAPEQVLFRYDAALSGFAARLSDAERDALRASGILLVENGRVFAAGSHDRGSHESGSHGGGAGTGAAHLGAQTAPEPNLAGSFAVDVYLFDTGIRSAHRALEGRVARAGFSTFDNGIAAEDCSGHGTHVAARIAGRSLGVSDHARLISVKVMDAFGGGDVATVIKGIDWVMAQPGAAPRVINMSLTRKHQGGVDPLQLAVDALLKTGAVVVVAAGNASQDVADFTPARIPGVITVGSVTGAALSDFSNAGQGVDLYAPGEAVTSASIRDVCGLREMSGTSMAAPYVSGLVAELLAGGTAGDQIGAALRAQARAQDTGALSGERTRYVLSARAVSAAQLCPPQP